MGIIIVRISRDRLHLTALEVFLPKSEIEPKKEEREKNSYGVPAHING